MVNIMFVMRLFNMLHDVSTSVSVPDSSLMRCDKEWDMRLAICSYAARAAEKLRSEHQYCRFISTFVKHSPLP